MTRVEAQLEPGKVDGRAQTITLTMRADDWRSVRVGTVVDSMPLASKPDLVAMDAEDGWVAIESSVAVQSFDERLVGVRVAVIVEGRAE